MIAKVCLSCGAACLSGAFVALAYGESVPFTAAIIAVFLFGGAALFVGIYNDSQIERRANAARRMSS